MLYIPGGWVVTTHRAADLEQVGDLVEPSRAIICVTDDVA